MSVFQLFITLISIVVVLSLTDAHAADISQGSLAPSVATPTVSQAPLSLGLKISAELTRADLTVRPANMANEFDFAEVNLTSVVAFDNEFSPSVFAFGL